MGAPTDTFSASLPTSSDAGALAEIDKLVSGVARRERQAVERDEQALEARHEFLDEFTTTCQRQVRPAMETVLRQLHRSGGGGLIEEHKGGEARVRTPRLTLWMSLDGDIVGGPHADRNPYLQLDADAGGRDVKITEGDMWRGDRRSSCLGSSGHKGVWQLAEVTGERVTRELVDILRLAAR